MRHRRFPDFPLSLFAETLEALMHRSPYFPVAPMPLPCALEERKGETLIRVELPDIPKDQIRLEVEAGLLRLHVTQRMSSTASWGDAPAQEALYGTVVRSFRLPYGTRGQDICADLHEGLLTIRVPHPEDSGVTRIEIDGE